MGKGSVHFVSGQLCLPTGFRAAGMEAGIKKSGGKDMALVASDRPAVAAGVFTTNQVKAASVRLCMKHLKNRTARAIVANSGNANCCNGVNGAQDASAMAALVAKELKAARGEIFVCSTGRIGVRMPMNKVEPGIPRLAAKLDVNGGRDAAEAIMTTDTRMKVCTARMEAGGKTITLSAMAKGAGMIEPHMATMLCFIVTDAAVDRRALQKALGQAADESFNRITVDGDMSTNDTVLCLANGATGNAALRPGQRAWAAFAAALRKVTFDLAMQMVRDGEGVTKFVTVRVAGARNARDADTAARAVGNSLLVKTSWVGDYPNWGRVMDALGYSGAKVVEGKVDIAYDGLPAALAGVYSGTPIEKLSAVQRKKEFTLNIDLNLGRGAATVYSCDCTEEYIRINV